MTVFDRFETPVGDCLVVVDIDRLVELSIRPKRPPQGRRDPSGVHRFREAVLAHFEGQELPRLPIDLDRYTPFQRDIYDAVRAIPRGKTLSYGEVAERAGHPKAARAVGQAMGANPVCLFIP